MLTTNEKYRKLIRNMRKMEENRKENELIDKIDNEFRILDQSIFDGKQKDIIVACVDYDGMLKFGDDDRIRYTWASERWRGANWLEEVPNTDFEPLTKIVREFTAKRPKERK